MLRHLSQLVLLSAAAHCWDFNWPESWAQQYPHVWAPNASAAACRTSHLNAFETVKRPVTIRNSPLENPDGPRVLPLNNTAGDQWEFDAVSADGTTGIVIGFYRDPNYDMLGAGSFRLSTEILLPNGTRYMQVDYPTDSIVEECDGFTRGTWRTGDEFSYVFEVSHGLLRRSRIIIDTPPMRGTFDIDGFAPARYADGAVFPDPSGSVVAAPFFYWMTPIPAGRAAVDMQIKGSSFTLSGIGGHERLWVAYSWYSLLEGMHIVRAVLGPYALTYTMFRSKIGSNRGREFPHVFLAEREKPVFAANTFDSPDSGDTDYVRLTKTYDGSVAGGLKDRATGSELELVSPASGRRWKFTLVHNALAFEFPLGEGAGGSGFADFISGGEVSDDSQQFRGVALSEQLVFPVNNPMFKSNYKD